MKSTSKDLEAGLVSIDEGQKCAVNMLKGNMLKGEVSPLFFPTHVADHGLITGAVDALWQRCGVQQKLRHERLFFLQLQGQAETAKDFTCLRVHRPASEV